MSDPVTEAAATASAQPSSQPKVPGMVVITTVNNDGTIIGDSGQTVYCLATFIPVVGMKIMVQEIDTILYGMGPIATSSSVGGGGAQTGDLKWALKVADQPGWWLLNGRSTTDLAQPALATYLGHTGTFSIPNAIGRTLYYADGTVYTIGGTGGTRTIDSTKLPVSPVWPFQDATHGHAIASGFILGTGGSGASVPGGSGAHADSTVAQSTGASLQSNGSGGQPFDPLWFGGAILIKL